MSKKPKVYVCRKLFMYYFLTGRGFVPFSTRTDKYDCKKLVWLYEDGTELRDSIEDFYAQKPETF